VVRLQIPKELPCSILKVNTPNQTHEEQKHAQTEQTNKWM